MQRLTLQGEPLCCTIRIMRWDKLTAVRTVALVLLGFAAIAICAFLFEDRAGWGVVGLELLALAYLTDPAPARS